MAVSRAIVTVDPNMSSRGLAAQLGDKGQSEVETRRHAAAGDPVPVDDDAPLGGNGAQLLQRVTGAPVRRRLVAVERPGPSINDPVQTLVTQVAVLRRDARNASTSASSILMWTPRFSIASNIVSGPTKSCRYMRDTAASQS